LIFILFSFFPLSQKANSVRMLLPFISKTMDETAPGLLNPAILPPNQLPCDLPSRCSAPEPQHLVSGIYPRHRQ
jgi:hypothetical protein